MLRVQTQGLGAGNNSNNDHQNYQDNRYSYLKTPAELHGPTFSAHNQPHTQPPPPSAAVESTIPQATYHHHPALYAPQAMHQEVPPPEKSPAFLPQTAAIPPLSEHPAQFAPYADSAEHTADPQNPRRASQPQLSQLPQPPPNVPVSPAPTHPPEKHYTAAQEQERREKDLAIVPDNNPLESHKTSASYRPPSVAPMYSSGRASITANYSMNHFPGQVPHLQQQLKGDTWNHGLCDCSDIGTCCLGLMCPCILYGRTQYRLNRKSDKQDPTNLLGYETCNASCTVMALLCGCQWLLATIQHSRTRRAYAIPGSIPSDCVRATCCTCCTLIQDEREIKQREEGRRQTVSTPYAPPGHMSFSPPPR
ncbi:hypothetical protein FQN51_002710 [Onygenales sp. PD_10]|nr:hypothetical protein FQN51_002710 [Onygenales sp. PD_10]